MRRVCVFLVLICMMAVAAAPLALAQLAYVYTARTAQTVRASGAVTAGSLTWTCAGTSCTISGPWPQPGVAACAALAQAVGPIVSYGRPGAMLDAAGISSCNNGVAPAAQLPRIDPSRTGSVTPAPILNVPMTVTVPVTAPPASTPPAVEALIEDFGRGDRVLHVVTPPIRWTGVGVAPFATGTPPLDPEVRWSGTTLRLPQGVEFTGTPDARSIAAPPRGGAGIPPRTTSPSGLWIEMPYAMHDMPDNVTRLIFACSLSASDTGVRNGDFSEALVVADTHEAYVYPTDGDAVGTVRMAVRLDPFIRQADLRAVQCGVSLAIYRPEGGFIEALRYTGQPTHRHFTPGLVPLAGAPFREGARFNIGG